MKCLSWEYYGGHSVKVYETADGWLAVIDCGAAIFRAATRDEVVKFAHDSIDFGLIDDED